MNSSKIKSFGRYKFWLIAGLLAATFNTAQANNEDVLIAKPSISCGTVNSNCLLSEIISRFEVLKQSFVLYNEKSYLGSKEVYSCNLDGLETASNNSISNNLVRESEVVEASKGCRYKEVPTNTAMWLLATALVSFVGASSKRRV